MTVIAVVAAGNMGRMLASRRDAVVAGTAGTKYLRMINDICWLPDSAVVAVFTNIGRLDVGETLASSSNTVMAAGTISRDPDMIKIRRSP